MKKIISFLADHGIAFMPVTGAVLLVLAVVFQKGIIAALCALTGLWLLAAYIGYRNLPD